MRKITPVMLVLLLVASLMANIDIAQLETNEVVEDTGARSGADVDLVAITSPKETVCEPTCRNELFVGQDTSFEVFIQNSGDAAITELGYKAQVWNADGWLTRGHGSQSSFRGLDRVGHPSAIRSAAASMAWKRGHKP